MKKITDWFSRQFAQCAEWKRKVHRPGSAATLAALLCAASAPVGAVDLLVSNFTDTPDPAVRGGTVAYSATITNNEADTATGVVLTIALDNETTFESVSDTTNCSHAAGTVTCNYASVKGDLTGPGSADVITVTVTARTKSTAGNTVSATAAVAGAQADSNAGNASLTQVTTVDNGADLGLTITPNPAALVAGGTVTYTAATSNAGPNAAGTVTVTTTLSPHVTYQSATGTGWSCSAAGQVVTCTRSSAAVGALNDIAIVGKVTGAQTGTITTTGVVAISGSATDFNNANDSSTANVTVSTGTDLSITKTASSSTPASGAAMTFTLLPRNLGPFSASDVSVTDTLPAGFTGISASGTGWTCGVAGQVVTCTAATYAVGATNNITVNATAPVVAVATAYTNTAQVTSTTADAINSNNSGSVNVTVMPDGVDLSITKSRSPNPVAQGANITSTIRVTNNGPQGAASGEITVVDTLPAGETYGGTYSGANWTCGAQVGQTVTCTYNAALNVGSSTSNLVLTTTAVGDGVLTNSACAVYTHATLSDPVAGNNCASAGVTSTIAPSAVDLQISKTVDVDPLAWNAPTLTYTVTVTNAGPGAADGITVRDVIPGYKSSAPATGVTASKTGGSTAATFNCATGSTVTCTQTGGSMASGETAIFTIAVTRPMLDSGVGKHTNTATVTSSNQGDTDPSNNSASVQVAVEPVADITVQNSVTPAAAQAGTNATYVLTVTNNGPSTAAGVTVTDVFTIGAGHGTMTFISATPSTGSCAAFNTGTNTLTCTIGSMASGATETVTVVVRPDYMSLPPSPRQFTNDATVATTTNESNAGNNTAQSVLSITQASLDLLVNNTDSPDPLGYVPASASPVFPDNVVTYRNTITNRGPSVASGLVLTYTMTPPAGKTMTFLGGKLASSGNTYTTYCNNQNAQVTGPATQTITCTYPASDILAASNATTDLYLDYQVDTQPSASGDTYSSTVSITSNEPETVVANNSVAQTTTIKMRADLQLAKSARAYIGGVDASTTTVQVRQPFYWVLTLTNAGPGDSQVTTITDTLPAGVSLYNGGTVAPYNAAPYTAGVVWSTNNAAPTNGTCTGSSTITCSIGLLQSGKAATVYIPVVSASNGTRNNCASATTTEVDPNAANNTSQCSSVTVQRSSIAGTVYSDLNNDGAKGGAEPGIQSVTVALNGTDDYGNNVSLTTTTNSSGVFTFSDRSPGSYTLTETQPAGYQDGIDAAGTAGGTVAGVLSDSISAITLPGNTAATGYLFGEVASAQISGYVFIDANSNATRDAADTAGITGITITLTGADDLGAVNTTATTGANGAYSFTNLRPGTYQVQQATINGLTHTGMTVGSKGGQDGGSAVGANTAVTGATKRTISNIPIVAADNAQNYNFGESGQGLSGYVYADLNNNGIKDAGEPGIPSVSVALSGTTSTGVDVCTAISPNPCTVATAADGSYSYAGLPASNGTGYTLTEQSQAAAPLSNYVDGTDAVGTLGGSGAVNDVFSGIVIAVGQFGQNYNFGERAASIAGAVYHDVNDNGVRDAGETAIAGVTVTLSGQTGAGVNVCTVIASCTRTTAADGSFSFTGLPKANGAGYTLTETQPVDYAERSNTVGNSAGSASVVGGNSVFSGITLAAGAEATGYLYGEKTGSISGFVYQDTNNNGTRDGGESGIAGVSVTLSGNTASNTDVCTTLGSCTVTTGADGSYQFTGLRNAAVAGYTLTEQAQNVAPLSSYVDGLISAGTNCGACTTDATSPNKIQAVVLNAANAYTGYNFGELPPASLAGRVYLDINNNASFDAGEELAGATLTLTGTDDRAAAVNQTATTAADGTYTFSGLRASNGGGYTITETQPAGYLDYAAATGTQVGSIGGGAVGNAAQNVISAIVLPLGQNGISYNFRENASSLAGFVYVDTNSNGAMEAGEQAIAGVTITLTGTDASNAAVNRTAVTAADGSYRFTGLTSGTYTLTETHPTAYNDGRETAGTAGGTVNNTTFDSTAARNAITAIALPAGTAATGYNFGEAIPPAALLGTISGFVYLDLNNDGVKDSGETGIAGITLTLTGTDKTGSAVNLSTISLTDGSYTFTNLQPSNGFGYTISETQPAAYLDGKTTLAAGAPGNVLSAKPVAGGASDIVGGISLAVGANLVNYNFGEQSAGSTLSGYVYADANDNGAKESDETGIAGVTVRLTGTDATGKAVEMSTTTGADGSYAFIKLPASGSAGYTVTEIQPSAYTDGKTTVKSGNTGVASATKPVTASGDDTIAGIMVKADSKLTDYNFGEKSAGNTISGFVYLDKNDNGVKDEGEGGIAKVVLVLTGTDINGKAVKLSTETGTDGSFSFTKLQPSNSTGYTITETQPPKVKDGKTTISGGSPGSAMSTKPVKVSDNDVIAKIVLPANSNLSGYLFGEIPIPSLKPPIVNGYVFMDRSHNRTRPLDGSVEGMPGWTVQLKQSGKLICTTHTDETGFYQFDNLHCAGYEVSGLPIGTGFSITFSKDGSNLPAVPMSGGGRGEVPPTGGQINNITLNPADEVVEQNLPLDPAGVVYDSVTRRPVRGAAVTISGPAGFNPATHLVGGTAAHTQVVGDDGLYQFLLQNDFPTGVYTLSVVQPAGYLPPPSTRLPACNGAPVVGLFPTPGLVQASDFAPGLSVTPQLDPNTCVAMVPGGATTTQYYFGFHITNGGSAPILNNHIPLDPILGGLLQVTKMTPLVNVARGDLVPYTITATNTGASALSGITVRDQMPPGFKYRSGSARSNGVASEPVVAGRTLSWTNQGFAPQEKRTYTLVLAVGSGVGEGDYVNQAFAVSSPGDMAISNVATAAVRIIPDATFDCPDIIGKVFDDQDANGYQDQSEPGIPAVRVVTPRGLLVTTDADGRFHVPCADIPNADRGANFVMKLDDRTLPSGYRITTENPRSVRVTRGKLVQLSFGAAIHRVVRIELADAAFDPDKETLRVEWNKQIDMMIEQLKSKPSVLRIAYQPGNESAEMVQRRIDALRSDIRRRWRDIGGMYSLAIETEGAQ